jgi:GT2 family glycosyltransferase
VASEFVAAASVVVPTFNRRASLVRTLEALAKQGPVTSSLEVVVVDDGSTDGTFEWLQQARYPYRLKPLRQANGGPAKARNAGVEAATAPLVIFIDDDTEPLPGLVDEHLAAHREADNLVVSGPLGSLPSYSQPWVTWEQRQVERQYKAMRQGEWAPTFRQFWTGNASVARKHLLAAGGFDDSFRRAEDVELGLRLRKLGLQFRFRSEARVLHHVTRSLDSWCEMHRRYGETEPRIFAGSDHVLRGNFARLHPATRALALACSGRAPAKPAIAALRAFLRGCETAGLTGLAQPPCSVLANLLFWDSLATVLGRERFESLVEGPLP